MYPLESIYGPCAYRTFKNNGGLPKNLTHYRQNSDDVNKGDLPHDEGYVSKLEDSGIKELNLSTIWPAPEVDPEALGTKGWSGEHIEFLTKQFAEIDKRRARGN
jgi:hypothetical protein